MENLSADHKFCSNYFANLHIEELASEEFIAFGMLQMLRQMFVNEIWCSIFNSLVHR